MSEGVTLVGAVSIANLVDRFTVWAMTWVTGSTWVAATCGLITYVAIFQGLVASTRKTRG